MLFNSPTFAIFLVSALLLFWSSSQRTKVYVLVGLSYYFYMYSYPMYFFLLAILTVLNFALGLEMTRRPAYARHLLVVAVTLDLVSLGFFKYSNFFLASLGSISSVVGGTMSLPVLDIILPLGISFFTFQMISYIVDTYRGEPAEESFWNFAAYVSFFPQLVAGPIVRPKTLLPQIKSVHTYNSEQVVRGIFLIVQGLVKKIVFADFLGGHVDKVYAAPGDFSGLATLVAVYAYAFQIYFDFSGYTDIAIGCGKLFGFEIPINFNLPYIAKNPRDFWRRWHISLSTWLRDYLYIPLGGNRKGDGRTYVNMMVTMLLGGLWHGANWTFVLWGAYHGVLICVQRFLEERVEFVRKLMSKESLLLSAISVVFTFHLVAFGLVVFRAESLTKVGEILKRIFAGGFMWNTAPASIVAMLVVAMHSHILRSKWDLEERFIRLPAPVQAFAYSLATVVVFLFFTEEQRFIYFQF